MQALAIPIDKTNIEEFLTMIDREEKYGNIYWENQYGHQMQINDWVFFVSYKKTIRIYKVKKIKENYLFMHPCLGELLWRDWDYIVNGKSGIFKENSYLLSDIKTKTINAIVNSHLKIL